MSLPNVRRHAAAPPLPSITIRALEADDLDLARQRLARIVGRDTAHLDEIEISRAVIETLAESACDGIVAPLFWLAAGLRHVV